MVVSSDISSLFEGGVTERTTPRSVLALILWLAHRGIERKIIMLKGSMVCRTTWVGDLKVFNEGLAKEFKTIKFSVATNRDYLQTKVDEEGKAVLDGEGKPLKVRESDFFRCEARNGLAELVERNLNLRKEDGKIHSRLIQMWGRLETVKVFVETPISIEGVDGTVFVDIPKTITTFIVDSIEFLDANPFKKEHKQGQSLKGRVAKKRRNKSRSQNNHSRRNQNGCPSRRSGEWIIYLYGIRQTRYERLTRIRWRRRLTECIARGIDFYPLMEDILPTCQTL